MSTESVPPQIGPYRVLELIGEGGMGTVYLAEQREPVRRRAAVKVIKLGMDSRAVLTRFEAERRALAMMEHSGIATVFDAGLTTQGQPYFAMEYVKGIPITDYCDQNKLPLQERIALFQKVCAGVQHAHLKGVMHRDLKPSNVLVADQDGKPAPKIIDFGLAKATNHHLVDETLFTEQGRAVGTPEYMSPEQAGLGGLDVDTRTDIYSLGVILYELLTGVVPFSRARLRQMGTFEMQRVIREQDPEKPSTKITTLGDAASQCAALRRTAPGELERVLRGDLDWITLKAMEKDRNRRYETAQEFAADLQRHLSFLPVEASKPSFGYRLRKFVRRHRNQLLAASAVLATALVGAVLATSYAQQAQERGKQLREGEEKLAAMQQRADANSLWRKVLTGFSTADSLHPVVPATVLKAKEWIREYGQLADRLPAMQAELESLRKKAVPMSGEERQARRLAHPLAQSMDRVTSREWQALQRAEIETTGYEFLDVQDDSYHWSLTRSVVLLQQFAHGSGEEDPGSLGLIRRLVEEAEALEKRMLGGDRPDWDAAIAAIRTGDDRTASKLYRNLELAPQFGLVPLGMDPMTKLWEFLHVPSHAVDEAPPTRDPASGRLQCTERTGIVFVLVPGGVTTIGAQKTDPTAPFHDPDAEEDEILHTVALAPYFLSKFEMTQAQWQRLGGSNPSMFSPAHNSTLPPPVTLADGQTAVVPRFTLRNPVEQVDWLQCVELLRQQALVLPTEAQWEHACRGGTTTPWSCPKEQLPQHANLPDQIARVFTRGSYGNYHPWSDGHVAHAPVGSFAPNAFGFHDMHGNVFEWCSDHLLPYRNPVQPGTGLRMPQAGDDLANRIYRGGDYRFLSVEARSANRMRGSATERGNTLGLRPARMIFDSRRKD